MLPEQVYAQIPGNRTLYIEKIHAKTDTAGYLEDWSANVAIYEKSERVKQGVLGPNKPLFHRGAGIYLKSISLRTRPVAFLMVNKDPGAFWALIGGILFTAGCAILLVLKWKKG